MPCDNGEIFINTNPEAQWRPASSSNNLPKEVNPATRCRVLVDTKK
jgi:hypothetical protein